MDDFKVGQRVDLLPPLNESEAGYAAGFNIVGNEGIFFNPSFPFFLAAIRGIALFVH